jgi:hypothetical protein
MRKTINGLVYDTNAAVLVAEHFSGSDRSSFRHFEEALYRTSKGAYFLHGEGGGRSPYAKRIGDSTWGWGSSIRPMSEQEAFAWCQETDQQDVIDAEFGHLTAEA